jgi:hypothetical protein
VSREYCLRRAPLIGEARAHELARLATDTPDAQKVLHNFIELFVRHG